MVRYRANDIYDFTRELILVVQQQDVCSRVSALDYDWTLGICETGKARHCADPRQFLKRSALYFNSSERELAAWLLIILFALLLVWPGSRD